MFFQVKALATLLLLTSVVAGTPVSRKSFRGTSGAETFFELESNPDYFICHMNENERCSLDTLPQDKPSLIFPGGGTRCISNVGSDFCFEVDPGITRDNVLLNFGGGGACWDPLTTRLGLCLQEITPGYHNAGIFNRTELNNPYRDWMMVKVPYCSGDCYIGNGADNGWITKYGDTAVQSGAINVAAVLDWMVEQFPSPPMELVVGGQSGGSYGAQMWASVILEELPANRTSFFLDSGVGVMPRDLQGYYARNTWNSCDIPRFRANWSPYLRAICDDESITVQDVMLETTAIHPSVPFGVITSKVDLTQRYFYFLLALMHFKPQITAEEFYAEVNKVFLKYDRSPNIIPYMIDGEKHVFTTEDWMYNVESPENIRKLIKAYRRDAMNTVPPPASVPVSNNESKDDDTNPVLFQWLTDLPNLATSECDGEMLELENWNGIDYCAVEFSQKTFDPSVLQGCET